jgi:hypothetical protein
VATHHHHSESELSSKQTVTVQTIFTTFKMDKLSIISGALFFAADVFAVVSLAMPHWIVSEIGGDTNIGLLKTCLTIYGRPNICFMPSPVRGEWLLTFICIVLGIICISVTIVLLALSYWEYRVMKFARWLGFVASKTIHL